MDKKKLRQYRSLKREQKMLEDKMEKLNERAERIPTVAGTVKGSMNTFPYIETHMRVVMSEPKQTDVIYRQMMINGKRQEQVDELLTEIEEFISLIPDNLIMLVGISWLHWNALFVKIVDQILVGIFNYLTTKSIFLNTSNKFAKRFKDHFNKK